METEIFYWTGAVVCWVLCIGLMSIFVVSFLCAPVVAYRKSMKYLWQWIWAATLVQTGFTHEEVEIAISSVRTPNGVSIEDLLKWVKEVKEHGDNIKKGKRRY